MKGNKSHVIVGQLQVDLYVRVLLAIVRIWILSMSDQLLRFKYLK